MRRILEFRYGAVEVLIVVGGLTVLTVGRYMEEWNSDCTGVGWEVLIGS